MMKFNLRWACMMGCALLLGACALKSPSRPLIKTYRMEYASPDVALAPPLPYTLSLPPVGIAPTFDTTRILYRRHLYQFQPYHYYRWVTHPAQMIGHDLARDFRQAGIFDAVLFAGSQALPEIHLEVMIEALYEDQRGNARQAVVALDITLLRRNHRHVAHQMLLQKQFSMRQNCRDDTPEALIEAMGIALQTVSRDIITAVYDSLSET
jgi:ABC-type uncharacterized transport system auxiliary subunit